MDLTIDNMPRNQIFRFFFSLLHEYKYLVLRKQQKFILIQIINEMLVSIVFEASFRMDLALITEEDLLPAKVRRADNIFTIY